MAFWKNTANQKIVVFAVDAAGAPKTGDALNITAQISLDCAATGATNDVNPSELDAVDAPGTYYFNMQQAETNADLIILQADSATAGVTIRPVYIYTEPVTRDANVVSMANNTITAAAIATGAIDADALATDAADEIADEVWDELIAGHLGAGSTGNTLNGLAPGGAVTLNAEITEIHIT